MVLCQQAEDLTNQSYVLTLGFGGSKDAQSLLFETHTLCTNLKRLSHLAIPFFWGFNYRNLAPNVGKLRDLLERFKNSDGNNPSRKYVMFPHLDILPRIVFATRGDQDPNPLLDAIVQCLMHSNIHCIVFYKPVLASQLPSQLRPVGPTKQWEEYCRHQTAEWGKLHKMLEEANVNLGAKIYIALPASEDSNKKAHEEHSGSRPANTNDVNWYSFFEKRPVGSEI